MTPMPAPMPCPPIPMPATPQPGTLDHRVQEVCRLTRAGHTVPEIAAQLGIGHHVAYEDRRRGRAAGLLPPIKPQLRQARAAAGAAGGAVTKSNQAGKSPRPVEDRHRASAAMVLTRLANILECVFTSHRTSIEVRAVACGVCQIVATTSTGWSEATARTAAQHVEAALRGGKFQIVSPARMMRSRVPNPGRPFASISVGVAPQVERLPGRGQDIVRRQAEADNETPQSVQGRNTADGAFRVGSVALDGPQPEAPTP